MPEHKDLTGTDLHEPKGIETAQANQIYVADGLGSGAWEHSALGVHGEMVIQSNVTAEVVATAVDSTLATDSDYTQIITGWSAGHLDLVTFSVDALTVPVSGDYEIHAWADILVPGNNQKVGIKYSVNETTPLSVRKIVGTSASAGDYINVAGSGYVALTANDNLSLWIATDKAGDPTVLEAGLVVRLVHENP